ncbi:MAG: hypothetical protein K2J46_03355 [Muribaculaceae bacterium]|nr:hypothetical protein [Muribaculaceae bacterium]
MKKFLLTLGVASMALTSFSATKILYQQNFETAANVEETGWSFGGASIEIASDEYGKFLKLSQGQVNGRSGNVTWGQDIFMKDGAPVLEGNTYNMSFDFCYEQGSNNQYNSCLTVFTNHTGVANQPYRNNWSGSVRCWSNFLYDMSQVNNEPLGFAIQAPCEAVKVYKKVKDEATGEETVTDELDYIECQIDYADSKSVSQGTWYTVSLDVNVETRVVDYSVISLEGEELQSGSITVPENDINGDPISMYAEGIWVMMARYQTILDIDNIVISYEVEGDVANPPTAALTRLGKTADDELDLNLRAYTISFLDGETLHVIGTDGKELDPVEWADCDGNYVYETSTSGVLKTWTTCGTATSDVIEMQVECVPVALPPVVATITSVEAGYGKTYTLTISSADVPLQPTIFINYEFTGANGETLSAEGEASGVKVTIPGEGTLKLTSESFGYQATTISVVNDIEFAVKKEYDFARLTDEEAAAAGFTSESILNSATTSGWSNWTARKRLYYFDEATASVNDEGETVYDKVYPFGYISEDNTENVIYTYKIDGANNPDGTELFPGITLFAPVEVTWMKHIGIATENGSANYRNVNVLDLDAKDFVVINIIGDYGSNSNHPVCETAEEYYALLTGVNEVYSASANGTLNEETGKYTVTIPVHRIDAVVTNVTVFNQVGGGDAVENVEAVKAVDNNWYSIDGVRVAQPTRPGLYIHNGKKIIVK